MPLKQFKYDGQLLQTILPNKVHEPVFRKKLSAIITEKYSENIADNDVPAALQDSFNFYAEEFINKLRSITDVSFFIFVYLLHEDTSILSYKTQDTDEFPIDRNYFNLYRRILKMILQESCHIDLVPAKTSPDKKWFEENVSNVECLIYLGDFLFNMVECISEEKITEGSIKIYFKDGLITFAHKKEWENFIPSLMQRFVDDGRNSIIDPSLDDDFNTIVKPQLGLDLSDIGGIMAYLNNLLHNKNPPMLCMLKEFFEVLKAEAQNDQIVLFAQGLILNRENVINLKDSVRSPYTGGRIIHRPILTLKIDGDDCILTHQYSFAEAMNTLFQNNITMGKIPEEWERIDFLKKVRNDYKDRHKNILEDPVENLLSEKKLKYERNVKVLLAKNHVHLSINHVPGEVDFIFIKGNKLYITDCKNLTKRYEVHGYYQDIAKFEKNGYNKKMAEKVKFFSDNQILLQEHLRIKWSLPDLDLTAYSIEGIFVINTPTLYMLDGEFKIYTFHRFNQLLDDDDFFNKYIIWPQDTPEHKVIWPFIKNLKALIKSTTSSI